MGIVDAFKPEDRTEITYSNFYNLIKQAAQYEIAMNAVNCDVPHKYIRETMTGKKENTERKSRNRTDSADYNRSRRTWSERYTTGTDGSSRKRKE